MNPNSKKRQMVDYSASADCRIDGVTSDDQIDLVEDLARKIWTDHYVPIIGAAQVEYMLDKFQSAEVMREQILNQDYYYFLISRDGEPAGYIGVQHKESTLFLSKLYVGSWARKAGLGKRGVGFVLDFAREKSCTTIRLTVNKNNKLAMVAYEKMGFDRIDQVVMDIGGGFVMDDYVYELSVPSSMG